MWTKEMNSAKLKHVFKHEETTLNNFLMRFKKLL